MKKRCGVAMAIAALATALATGCGAEKAKSTTSAAESTAAAMPSAGESATSDAASKGENAASRGEKKFADFKAEGFKADDDITAQAEAAAQVPTEKHEKPTVADGTYQISVTLSDGSGRARIASPTEPAVKDGRVTAKIVWSSDKYDYMEVEGICFTPEIQSSHSVFMVSVTELDKLLTTVGDMTMMSTPHAIDYQLTFEL